MTTHILASSFTEWYYESAYVSLLLVFFVIVAFVLLLIYIFLAVKADRAVEKSKDDMHTLKQLRDNIERNRRDIELALNSVFHFNTPRYQRFSDIKGWCVPISRQKLGSLRDNPLPQILKILEIPISQKTVSLINIVLETHCKYLSSIEIYMEQQKKVQAKIIQQYRIKKCMLDGKRGFMKESNFCNPLVTTQITFLYRSPLGRRYVPWPQPITETFLATVKSYIESRCAFSSPRKERAKMTADLREYIKKRDRYTCQQCGISIRDEPHLLLEVDHIVPISCGGRTELDNLQTLCWKCNRRKGSKI